MTHALLNRFENSYSFANAKDNMSLLEEINYWESQFEDRIRKQWSQTARLRNHLVCPVAQVTLSRNGQKLINIEKSHLWLNLNIGSNHANSADR